MNEIALNNEIVGLTEISHGVAHRFPKPARFSGLTNLEMNAYCHTCIHLLMCIHLQKQLLMVSKFERKEQKCKSVIYVGAEVRVPKFVTWGL